MNHGPTFSDGSVCALAESSADAGGAGAGGTGAAAGTSPADGGGAVNGATWQLLNVCEV